MTAAVHAALVRLRRPIGVLVSLPATDNFPALNFSADTAQQLT
jgi:hypothetical protein